VSDDPAADDSAADDAEVDVDDQRPPSSARRRRVEWLAVLGIAIVVAILVRVLVVEQYRVEGESMLSTLHDGDRVLVDKLSYRFHDPRRGDVVVRELSDVLADEDLIKRVIGLPGETVELEGCSVRIDGVALAEPYLDGELVEREGCGQAFAASVVPADSVFVLGDHRGASRDSRSFGAVNDDDIVGRARMIIWPPSDWSWL